MQGEITGEFTTIYEGKEKRVKMGFSPTGEIELPKEFMELPPPAVVPEKTEEEIFLETLAGLKTDYNPTMFVHTDVAEEFDFPNHEATLLTGCGGRLANEAGEVVLLEPK